MPTVEQLDESPSPSPSRNPFRVGFRPATLDDPPLSPFPSPSTSPESLDESEDLASGSGDEWDAASYPESLDGTPSPGSTPDSDDAEAVDVELFDDEDLQTLARGGVAFAGEKAHELLATTPGKKAVGLYRTDEKDQAQIGDPIARIAGRHSGGVGPVNPDTKDLLSALVGIAGYGLKQINRVSEARALDAGAAGLAGAPQPIPEARDL